jgi:hypothetical protein
MLLLPIRSRITGVFRQAENVRDTTNNSKRLTIFIDEDYTPRLRKSQITDNNALMTPEGRIAAMIDENHGDTRLTLQIPITEVLINPTWEQMVQRDPLIAFSWYLSGRKNVLLAIADEIIENLDRAFSGTVVAGGRVERAESLMWLWTLGAYEVVRTMCQAKNCFSERASIELTQLKKTLSMVRMPAAKMEKPGKKAPVTSNRSPAGWDVASRDLLVSDPESKPDVSARFILKEFSRVFSAMMPDDVLALHDTSYA